MTNESKPLVPVNPEGLDELAQSLLETQPEVVPQQSTSFPKANIKNPQDYVRVPNSNVLIGKFEDFKGMNWMDTHYKLAENGLFMPTPAIFIPYFLRLIDAHEGKLQLFDGTGKPLPAKEVDDIYKHLTTNHINNGAYSWLDAKFDGKSSRMQIATDHRVQSGKILSPHKNVPLEDCLVEDCFADLELNSQGFPTKKSQSQKYEQGRNIRFWYPRNGAVARFGADSGRASLGCYSESAGLEFRPRGISVCNAEAIAEARKLPRLFQLTLKRRHAEEIIYKVL